MKEIWKDIKGYEGLYQISNKGRVKSLSRFISSGKGKYKVEEKIKKPSKRMRKDGTCYMAVVLYKNNKYKNFYIHRLVANAFLENPDKKETVNHINGNKEDNIVENLEWNTYSENNNHAYITGLNDSSHRRNNKSSFKVFQYDKNMNLIASYPSIREAERKTGIRSSSISLGIKNNWKYGGYIWKKGNDI